MKRQLLANNPNAMKIKRCKDVVDFRTEVAGAVKKLLGEQASEKEIQDATACVVNSFLISKMTLESASIESIDGRYGEFCATANSYTGEFSLYREIV
jgi:hypothetical protein